MPGQEREREYRQGLERLIGKRFVVDIEKYEGRSGRLIGIRELQAVGARTPEPFFVATHEAFEEYKIQGMTAELRQPLLEAFQQIRAANPNRGAFVGWRTETAGGPVPGPRTTAITDPGNFLHYIESSWQWGINQGYHQQPGTEIALALHPFLHAGQEPRPSEFFLWPGGDAAVLIDGKTQVRATYGADESIQGFACDVFFVQQGTRKTIITKNLPPKEETLKPTETGYEKVSIPPEYQDRQTLTDSQVLQVAEIIARLNARYPGFHRVEFMLQEEGVMVRECCPYYPEPESLVFLQEPLTAPATVINDEKDIDRVNGPTAIVFLPQSLFQERKVADISLLLVSRAKEKDIKMAVLAWGELLTQHMTKNFRDAQITVVFIGDREIPEGKEVRIFQKEDGQPVWEISGKKKEIVIDLDQTRAQDPNLVGEKTANVAILRAKGLPTVPGFCVTIPTLDQHLKSLGLREMADQPQRIRKKILDSPLPSEISQTVQKELTRFPGQTFAVRSSSAHENIAAGQFETRRDVSPDNVPKAIKICLASLFSPAALVSAQRNHIRENGMAVLIHPMVQGPGGVIYTSLGEIIISSAETAELVTSGAEASPQRITLDRKLKIKKRTGREIINPEQARDLAEIALQVEEIFGTSQDIEWTINEETGKIVLLQARPR